MKRARVATPLVLLAAGALLLSGCSNPTATASGEAGDWADATADLDGVTLTLWTAQSTSSVPEGVIAAFEEATGATVDNVTVPDQYETNVQTQLATGETPDLMFWQATESGLRIIQAPEKLQSLDGAPWLEKLDEPSQKMGTLDDVHYAAPIKAPSVIGVYYNKSNFEKAGITETPVGYDGLLDAAQKLKAAGVVAPAYEASADRWPNQWCVQTMLADEAADGFWERINENEDSFTNPKVVEAIERCEELYTTAGNPNIKTATFAEQAEALLSGEAGMVVQVNALVDQMAASADLAELDENIGFFPISPTGNVGTVIDEQTNTVVAFKSGDAEREAATRQFLRFWLEDYYPTFIEERGYVSLQPDVPTPDNVPQIGTENYPAAVEEKVGSMQNEAIVNPDLYLYLVDMYYGEKTPEQVAEATQENFVQLATAVGAEGF
ncbi:ABC transporter substrate-binding protein [Microbacterium sp. DT81.1]|uniref:ABC transporter substrate-binding protein n=1 Tax=Microbacterium sp. DT81.1 TaxID=3393413 RepID=UPI003CF5A8CC